MKTCLSVMLLTACGLTHALELDLDNAHSEIVATARATGHQFTAVPDTYTCHIALSEAGSVEAAEFAFDFHDLHTGKPKRDKEMLHWLEVESYPELRFQMNGTREEAGTQVITGVLSFHGTEQTIEIPVRVTETEQGTAVSGDTEIDVRDFGLKKIRKFGFLTVNPVLEIHFSLQGHTR